VAIFAEILPRNNAIKTRLPANLTFRLFAFTVTSLSKLRSMLMSRPRPIEVIASEGFQTQCSCQLCCQNFPSFSGVNNGDRDGKLPMGAAGER